MIKDKNSVLTNEWDKVFPKRENTHKKLFNKYYSK